MTRGSFGIVGGGVIGLMTARELARAGRRVVLLDRQALGREASWAGGGILSPLYAWRYPAPVNILARWSQVQYRELVESLRAATGVDPEWTRSGLLILDTSEAGPARAWAGREGVILEQVDRPGIETLEPRVAPDLGGALWMPEIAQVRNPRLLRALIAELRHLDVEIRDHQEVTGFDVAAGRVRALRTTAGDVPVMGCLVAAGAWAGAMLSPLGLKLPIRPVRGQMLLLKGGPGQLQRILLKDYHYLIPRRDGRILAGSTMEEAGFESATTPEARAALIEAIDELAPGLRGCLVEQHWAGLRPGSPQGIPYIGPHPEIAGLYVCAGHYRNGLVLGPASARLVADLILGREPILDPRPYRLDRVEN